VTTTYKILYWQEIPSQIKAEDERDEVTLSMPPRFLERIDQLAAQRGLQDADDYLGQWQWSEEQQRDGSARDVAEAVRSQLEAEGRW
jgi:Virulence factor